MQRILVQVAIRLKLNHGVSTVKLVKYFGC